VAIEITKLGYIVLPIGLGLLFFRPRWMLAWTAFLAPFQAASVLNMYIGNYPLGLQPGYFAGFLFVFSELIRFLRRGKLRYPRKLGTTYLPLFFLAVYAMVGAIILPVLFQGSILVLHPRGGISLNRFTPLRPTATNISQSVYMAFLAIFAFIASHSIALHGNLGRNVIRAYLLAGILVASIGIWQVLAWHVGVPFPTDLLYSNPGYAQAGAMQTIGGIKRLSSTLAEPSLAAYYLVGVFAFALELSMSSRRARIPQMAMLLSLVALLLTTSTTAYVTLTVVLAIAALRHIWSRRGLRNVLVYSAILVFVVVLGLLSASFSGWIGLLQVVMEKALLKKVNTLSFKSRIGADLHSLSLVLPTWGLGVGWGSNRASSLLANLIGNGGLWGTMLFVWFLFVVVRLNNRHLNKAAMNEGDRLIFKSLGLSLVAMLVAGVLAIPDTTLIAFWVNLAALVGLASRQETPASGIASYLRTSPRDKRHKLVQRHEGLG